MAQYLTYTVKAGDSLSKIAALHSTTVGDLIKLNGISNPDLIAPGQIINISRISETTYTVQRGDFLGVIGKHYGVTIAALAEANNLNPPYLLQVGQVLKIPSPAELPPPVPSPTQTRATPPATVGGVPTPGVASIKAAEIARRSVLPRSTGKCYRYVKLALQAAGVVDHYLGGAEADEAGPRLLEQGFVDILPSPGAAIRSPYDAPTGAVLVYKATAFATDKNRIYGHIEMRTADGFASDYFSPRARTGPRENGLSLNSASGRALVGVYVKPDRQSPAMAMPAGGALDPGTNKTTTQAVAAVAEDIGSFSMANLALDPANGKYRGYIEEAAQRTGMAPQTVAAIIDAEAAKVAGTKQWDANSAAKTSSARGLTQFLRATWRAEAIRDGGLLNREAKLAGFVSADNSVNDEAALLNLRLDPRISILAGADLAVVNLAILTRLEVLPNSLDPGGRAKIAYLAHHEGAANAARFLRGAMNYVSQGVFDANVPASKRAAAIAAAGGDIGNAYRNFLATYIDERIDVTRFMGTKTGVVVPKLAKFYL